MPPLTVLVTTAFFYRRLSDTPAETPAIYNGRSNAIRGRCRRLIFMAALA
jgi:hypothetical protein